MKNRFYVEVEYDNEKTPTSQISKLLDSILNQEEEDGKKKWEEWMVLIDGRWELVKVKIGNVELVKG